MSDDTSDTVIIEVDSQDENFSGAEEQDDNDNNMEQEDNNQAHNDEQRDEDEDQEDDQDIDENSNMDNNVTNVTVQKNEASAVLQTQKCEQVNGKNEKKKWEKNKNCKATGKGGPNNQNGNTNNNQNGNANNKNSNSNNNQFKNKGNSQQSSNSNQSKNAQNINQNKPNHQNNTNNNYNNNKTNNSNSDKNIQDNKKIQSGENKNNHNNQNKSNNQNSNNSNSQNNNNNKSNNSYNNNNNNQNKTNNNNNNNNNSNNNNKDNNNKDSNNKGSGVGAQDILKTLRGLIQGPKKYEKPWPLDSFVLRLHYRMGVAIFLLGFLSIKGNWYWRDNIVARSLYNAEKNIETIYENICLSYPYVEVPSEIRIKEETNVLERGTEEETTRRYLLYYRWVYWSFLLFAGIFYIPRALAKRMDNSRLRKLLEELNIQESRYDANGWDKNCDTIISYLHRHQGTHLGLYFNLVMCHLFALVIDIGTILFFDFILDGHFLFLLYHVWPLKRDPQNFQDPLSSAFPPFAMCQITPGMKIMAERTETYGIHLAHMEMYEKVFLMLWVWLLVMLFLVALKILALFIMFLPFTHWLFLGTSKSNKSIRKMKRFVLKTYGLGDMYAIFVIKKHISDAEFRYFLSKLSKIEEVTEKKLELHKDDVKNLDDGRDQTTGNYQRNINNQWIIDEFQPNAPPDVTYPPNLTLGDYFPEDYLRQRRTASTPKPPPNQPVVPAFPVSDPVSGQPRYGWNNTLYQQACYDHINGIKTPQKCLPTHAV